MQHSQNLRCTGLCKDLRQSIGLTADSIFYAGGGWGFQKFPLCEAGYASVLDKLRFRQDKTPSDLSLGVFVFGLSEDIATPSLTCLVEPP